MFQSLEQQQGRGSTGQIHPCNFRCLKAAFTYKPGIAVYPTVLAQGAVSKIGERAEEAVTNPLGLSDPWSPQERHCCISRNCEGLGSATAPRTVPRTSSFARQKLSGKAARSVQMSAEQTAFLALAPFPSGCSSSGTSIAQRMSSSLFQVEFALGHLPGNQNKLLIGL